MGSYTDPSPSAFICGRLSYRRVSAFIGGLLLLRKVGCPLFLGMAGLEDGRQGGGFLVADFFLRVGDVGLEVGGGGGAGGPAAIAAAISIASWAMCRSISRSKVLR
jgi:hypothetical protein